jgi:hypothetical protein
MGYLDSAEDLFRDMDAIRNRQKYQDALKVQTRRNETDEIKIRNYDKVVAQRDFLLKVNIEESEMAETMLNNVLEDLRKNGLDSDSGAVSKDPGMARFYALKRKAICLIKAQANVHYTNEFKVELEERFRQEYQRQGDRIIETARTAPSGTPEEKERAVKNLVQKIQASYPPDVFASLQNSWRIWCDECQASHLHFITAGDVTALLRHSSVKLDTRDLPSYYLSLETPFPTFHPHTQEVQLATFVRGYLTSRVQEEQHRG